jgi:hypothetical protein
MYCKIYREPTAVREALHVHQMNCVIVDASKCPARTHEAVILQERQKVCSDRRLKSWRSLTHDA